MNHSNKIDGRYHSNKIDGRYHWEESLGAGRYANVYLAKDERDPDKRVIIKILKLANADRQDMKEAFKKEYEILKRMRNRGNVVEVEGEGVHSQDGNKFPYIILKPFDPEMKSVSQIVGDRVKPGEYGLFLEEDAVELLKQLCEVLNVAHGFGIAYTEVLSEHMFWNLDGKNLKVIDWNNATVNASRHSEECRRDLFRFGILAYYITNVANRSESGVG